MDFIPFRKKSLSDEVKSYLYKYIKEMDLEENTKLPPEEAIAQNLGVSRVTVRRSLTDLEREGLIFRVHGRGTFVNQEALQLKANIGVSKEFEQMIIESGYKARVELVNYEIVQASYKDAEKLNIDPEDLVVIVEKIFYADENPAILCIDTFPLDIVQGEITKEEAKLSIFELMRTKASKILTWDKIEVFVSTKTQILNCHSFIEYMKNDSFLIFESINYDQNNCPSLLVTTFYDTNYIRFNMIRQTNVKY